MKEFLLIAVFGLVAASRAYAVTGVYQGERTSGTQRICTYKAGAGKASIAVPIGSVCPRTTDIDPRYISR